MSNLREIVYDPVTGKKVGMIMHLSTYDMVNVSKKKVLNTLDRYFRLKLSLFFYEKKDLMPFSVNIVGGKGKLIKYSLDNVGDTQNLFIKSLSSSIRYFVSREKALNTADFKFDIFVSTKDGIKKSIGNVPHSFFAAEQNEFLKSLKSYVRDDFLHDIVIGFKGAFFSEDPAETKINKGKTFVSEKCVVCLENDPKVGFLECGHICLCEGCFKIYESGKCTVCRKESGIIVCNKS